MKMKAYYFPVKDPIIHELRHHLENNIQGGKWLFL